MKGLIGIAALLAVSASAQAKPKIDAWELISPTHFDWRQLAHRRAIAADLLTRLELLADVIPPLSPRQEAQVVNEIAELLEQARIEVNSLRRHMLYQEFQTSFAEQAIAIPLYYPLYSFAARATIGGIQLGYLARAADRFRGIGDWRLAARPG